MVTLTTHPDWPLIWPWIRIEDYDRDGGHSHPRKRIEMDAPGPAAFRRSLLALTVNCVSCKKRIIRPIRLRKGSKAESGHFFIAVTCELAVTYSCSRSKAARLEYIRIVDEVRRLQKGRMTRLEELQQSVEGNDLMNQMLEDVERDKKVAMDRCVHCGINLAKVKPLFIVDEWHDKKLTGRRWCSIQCRDYWMRAQDMRQRRPGQAEGSETAVSEERTVNGERAVSHESTTSTERAVARESTVPTERAVDGESTDADERAERPERTDDKERGM